ncbi:hypothetical protein CsatA_004613 [Cannabis sativa]
MCRQIVHDNWDVHESNSLSSKIKCCNTALVEWEKDITGNFKQRINSCHKILKLLKNRRDVDSVNRYKEAQNRLFKVLAQKEVFWKQRSKKFWLQSGDQNTKYFHACASTRQKNNQILSLKKEVGFGWIGKMAYRVSLKIILESCS